MYGADVGQLTALGNNLTRQIDVIDQIIGTVDGAINGTAWTGPARDRFVEEWNVSFKGALGRLSEAFGTVGRDCTLRAQQLDQLMGRI